MGLASIILYPNLQDKESGYVMVMIDHLPASLRGLMVAAFAAAFMSTIGTQLNWGASYLVNDFYRRFLRPNESERRYVRRPNGRPCCSPSSRPWSPSTWIRSPAPGSC